jgi:tetratricopeptide (TPR) repeat protein
MTHTRLLTAVAMAAAMVAVPAIAQKKTVSQAQSIAKGTTPDFAEARELIQAALQHDETSNDPKTWYVAGYIEDQQFSAERMKEVLGTPSNQSVMYEALLKELGLFEKAIELDRLPDAKGKVKPKYEKDIKGILAANHLYYINGGAYYFDERDYHKAHDAFTQYLRIAENPLFKGEKAAERDSNYMTVRFYAAVAATQLGESETAVAALRRATEKPDFRLNEVYQYLFNEYDLAKDTAAMEAVLKEAMERVPEEPFFLLNLINIYIYTGRNAEAVDYLNQAIARDPANSMLYNALGSVYEDGLKNDEEAERAFTKALEIDPEYVDAISNLGRVYYNQAINKQNEANQITDNTQYRDAVAQAKLLFEKARPYFEKAASIKPEEMAYKIALRGIYYNLNLGKELADIEKELSE